ncbi:MAG: NAD(P)/FAD-dependent oxidoreductase [Acidimicrobiia bacterium]|nr:NAD(P)/FAD-dependent oxidoreductase [Acidimicrobiia bacterium]
MTANYDLIVVGAGMAGISAANKAAAAGWRTAIVDELPYGGTCALRGCDPKKILRHGAEIVDAADLMRHKGIDENGLSINWADLMRHTRGFTDPVPGNAERELASNGVDTLHGTATFTSPTALEIDDTVYEPRNALIATGARPRPLGFPGADQMIDSTEFLHLESLPGSVVFVGGGFISFEFAHIAARAGSAVTIIDRGDRPLRGFDPDLVGLLVARSATVGIALRTRSTVDRIEATGSGHRILLDTPDGPAIIEADLVVHGAGRIPNLSTLELDTAGVAHTDRGVTVAAHLQSTTNSAVYAAGDAADTDGMALTPVAVFEGKVAVSNMTRGHQSVPDYRGVPTTVFTIPELARVGLLEHDARERGLDIEVRFTDTSGWYSNYRIGETTAAVKVLVDTATDTIVGAHMLGPGYAELINICGLTMKLGLTTRQLKSATAAYPTVGSDLGSML